MSYTVTLSTVILMIAYAIPGYLLMKTKMTRPTAIPAYASLLLYVCTPVQMLYGMQKITRTAYMLKYLVWTFVLSIVIMGSSIAILYFITRKKQSDPNYRILTTASILGNCSFMGIPLLEALMPDYPQMIAFTAVFFFGYCVLMWTVASFIITRDNRYIRVRKIFMSPPVLAIAVSLILFFTDFHFTGQIAAAIELLSKMSTPLCMFILGGRLALIPLKSIFIGKTQYIASAIKLILFPLFMLGVCRILPLEKNFIRGLFIIAAVPAGNMVLGFAEIFGEGQQAAANVVLLSTLLSIITLPAMLLLI